MSRVQTELYSIDAILRRTDNRRSKIPTPSPRYFTRPSSRLTSGRGTSNTSLSRSDSVLDSLSQDFDSALASPPKIKESLGFLSPDLG